MQAHSSSFMSPSNRGPHSPSLSTLGDTLRPYEEYYMVGGDLHFLVGIRRFRVHSFFFIRESKYWRNRMAGPVSPGDATYERPGFHETTAFVVDDVEADDFALFLWVFYNPKYNIYNTSLKNWITILHLATKWECPGIREVAITAIDRNPELGVIEKIKLYQSCKVPRNHLLPLYMKLATRQHMLDRDDFRMLDSDALYFIVRAREMLRAPPAEGDDRLLSPIRTDFSEEEKDDIFATAFETSPEEIQALRTPVANGGISNPERPSGSGTRIDRGVGPGSSSGHILTSNGRGRGLSLRGKLHLR